MAMDKCPKCGRWRNKGIELVTHIQICKETRCPACGHPAAVGKPHYCPAYKAEVTIESA